MSEHDSASEAPLEETPLEAILRRAAPTPPEGLAERVLSAVREVALAKIRFREELERSARGSLIAAAAGLLACAALFLGVEEAGRDTATITSPTASLRASAMPEPELRSPALGNPDPQLAEIDDAQVLSISSPPGVLQDELTSGLWLFAEEDE